MALVWRDDKEIANRQRILRTVLPFQNRMTPEEHDPLSRSLIIPFIRRRRTTV